MCPKTYGSNGRTITDDFKTMYDRIAEVCICDNERCGDGGGKHLAMSSGQSYYYRLPSTAHRVRVGCSLAVNPLNGQWFGHRPDDDGNNIVT